MRAAVGSALVIICLGLAGCSLFGKKHAAQTSTPKPFLGSETPTKAENAALPRNTDGPMPGANGVLAGRVVVEATGRPVYGASIALKSLDHDNAKDAKLDFLTDERGYFYIARLNPGEHYELIARANDNGDLISRTIWTSPPKPTLLIRLDKAYTTQSTPPPEKLRTTLPDKKGTPSRESSQERTPAVQIDPPVKMPDSEPQPRGGITSPAPAAGPGTSSGGSTSGNPSNIANDTFHRIPQPSVPVDIPSKPWSLPPVPGSQQWESIPEQGQPSRSAPAVPRSYGSVQMPNISPPVPSCGLYGNKLDNFALYDLDGRVWEYKRDRNRRSRLMLLDFWYSSCTYCLQTIYHLKELQRDYNSYGLEIVSIACETGPVEEQRKNVLATRGRYNINYLTLLSGGGPDRCPVINAFQVKTYPLLVLIDENGTIIWRSPSNGMDDNAYYNLKRKIHDRLVMREPPR